MQNNLIRKEGKIKANALKLANFSFLFLVFIFLISFSSADLFALDSQDLQVGLDGGPNEIGVNFKTPFNFSTVNTVNTTFWWITNEGAMDNVPDLYPTLDLIYWRNDGTSTATADWDIGANDFYAKNGFFEFDLELSGNGNQNFLISTDTATSYSRITLKETDEELARLTFYGARFAGTQAGIPKSNLTLFMSEVGNDDGGMMIGTKNQNPLYFITDNIVRMLIDSVGDTYVNGSLLPLSTLTFDIGSGAARWLNFYVQNLNAEEIDAFNLHLSENLTIDGNATVTGSIDMGGDLDIDGSLIVDGNTSSNWFNGKFNWTTGDTWNSFDGTILIFNETFLNETIEDKIRSIEYNASSFEVQAGTVDAGNLLSIQIAGDNDWLNISEDSGIAPVMDLIVNFTGVENFDSIQFDILYDDGGGHEVQIGIWDCVGEGYDFGTHTPNIVDMDDLSKLSRNVLDPSNHICTGDKNVSVKFSHIQNGNALHSFHMDDIKLISGAPVSSPVEVDPFSIHSSGDVPWMGNEDGNGFNSTGWDFIFANNITQGGLLLDDIYFKLNGSTPMQGNANWGDNNLTNVSYGLFDNVSISSLTTGSIPFVGASGVLTEDNSNLFWDNVNKRLGIGTDSPSVALDLGDGTTTRPFIRINGFTPEGPYYGEIGTNQHGNLVFQGTYNDVFFSGHLKIDDNKELRFGSDNDFALRADTFNNQLKLWDFTNTFLTIKKQGTAADFDFNVGQFFIQNDGNVGIGVTDPGQKLTIGSDDGSDRIEIYHTNSNAFIKWDDGSLKFTSTEATNVNTWLDIIPTTGTGWGGYRVDGTAMFRWKTGEANVDTIPAAGQNMAYFTDATEGETKELIITGRRTGDSKRTLEIGVGVDADDTASFDGVSNYLFDGMLRASGLNITGTSYLGDIVIDTDNITTNNIISRDGNISFFNSSGSEVVRFTGDGNVGIGTDSPDALLHVAATGFTPKMLIQSTTAGGGALLELRHTDRIFGIQSRSNSLQIRDITDGDSVRFIIDDTGNVGIGVTDPGQKLTIGSDDGTDRIEIYHDNSNAFIKWDDGVLQLQTDEGTNTHTTVAIKGKGTGIGFLELYDQDNAEFMQFRTSNGAGYLSIIGSSPDSLRLQSEADVPVEFFKSFIEGTTQELKIWGYKTGDAFRSLEIGVGTDADDTASFDGVSNYLFDGNIGLGVQPTQKLTIGSNDGSDRIEIFHDNTDAQFRWDDGILILRTDEGTDTKTIVSIFGKGTGDATLRVSGNGGGFINTASANRAGIAGEGTVLGLDFQQDAEIPIDFFRNAAEGETQEFKISGFRTGDSKRQLEIGVGVDADDTASFDGVSNYLFDGNIISNDRYYLSNGASIGGNTTCAFIFYNQTGSIINTMGC